MDKVTIETVKNRLNNENKKIRFVDSRAEKVWEKADTKAAGAVRIPPDSVEEHISDVGRDDYIVTYCTWPNEASSARVAQKLEENGFNEVHPLIGGYDAYEKANLPVESK